MNFIENGVKQNSLIFKNAAKGVAFHHAGMMTEERNIGKSPIIWAIYYGPIIRGRSQRQTAHNNFFMEHH